MPDYSKGKIYTIRCRTDETLIYVGSTIQPLSVRIGEHKRRGNNVKYQNIILYKTINNNWDDWYMELYEEYPCENKEQLNQREGVIIRHLGTLNSKIAGRNQIEYYQDNKEQIIEKHKIYRKENKDKLLENKKEYYENYKEIILKKAGEQIKCECGCIMRRGDITKHKKTPKHIKLLDSLNIN
jgi:hypothetical protein